MVIFALKKTPLTVKLPTAALNGDAIMCVVIFAGIREQAVVDTWMDMCCATRRRS